jgi:hypothetical protein
MKVLQVQLFVRDSKRTKIFLEERTTFSLPKMKREQQLEEKI